MWERWKKGKSLQQIAQLFDRNGFVAQIDLFSDRALAQGKLMV